MLFDRSALLEPISNSEPCGPALNEHSLYDDFRSLANASERIEWGRYLDRALQLAQDTRDLRAWVWLTRSALCAEGVPGLAAGLQLIADGLERYWEILPPQHADEHDPVERYMVRLSTLTQLGATHYACTLADLRSFGRNYTDLQADLSEAIARASHVASDGAAANEARRAALGITQTFTRGFAPGFDPMVNFDTINIRLDEIAVDAVPVPEALPIGQPEAPQLPPAVLGAVKSRADVLRALDLILAYYEAHEPCSPVPLLIARAKRLVPSTFMEALKDLAPAGLNELRIVAGSSTEST